MEHQNEYDSDSSLDEDVFWPKKRTDSKGNNSEKNAPQANIPNSLICRFCQAAFTNRKNRWRHERSCPSSPSACQVVKVCTVSKVGFNSQRTLNEHKKKCKVNSVSYTKCVEPSCEIKFHTRLQIVSHLEKDHFHKIDCKELTFENEASFQKWKKNEDMIQFMSTVKHTGNSNSDKVSYIYYVYNFDVQNRKTNVKHKIPNCKCPARLMIKIVDKKYFVKYIRSHTHSLEPYNLQFHQLSEQTLNFIKACLVKGMSPWNIWRELVPPNDGKKRHDERDHYITLRHIKKIHYKLLRSTQLDANDAEAVKLLAFKMQKEQDSVLVYKPQGQPTLIGDDSLDKIDHSDTLFAFGFQSQRMLDELKLAQSKILCIDATHNTNKYKFYLLNLIVPDEYGVGYPVTHFIVNTLDTETLISLFQNIKNKCPDLEVAALMTDDDKSTWDAFKSVFGDKAKHLLCKWHVHRTWQRQLAAYIKDIDIRNNVYKDLIVILEERNSTHFHTMVESFITTHSKLLGSQGFIEYFQTYYCNRVNEWAMSYRNFPHGETDTNMFCESFHSVFKRHYLNRMVNSRIDNLINRLIDYEYSKYLELNRKRVFRQLPKGLAKSEQEKRHDRGMKIKDSSIVEDEDTPNQWFVKSASRPDDVEHTVVQFSKECFLPELCFLKCSNTLCTNLCSHLYFCSCEDRHSLCKHIHKVHALQVKTHNDIPQYTEEVNEQAEFGIYSSPAVEHPPSVVNQRDNLTKLCRTLNEKLACFLGNEKVQGSLLPHIYGTLNELNSMCQSVSEGDVNFPTLPSMEHPYIAPNQKETKQKSFFQTIKRRKVSTPLLQYPSMETQFSLKTLLLNFNFAEMTLDFEDYIACSWAELIRPLFSLGEDEYLVTLVDLKSIDDKLPDEERRRLELLSSGQFRFAWLTDSIIDAFLYTFCCEHPSVLHVKSIIVQQVMKEDVDLEVNDFWSLDFTGKTHIYISHNFGNHWVSILVCLETEIILFLDPSRLPDSPADSLFEVFDFGRKLINPMYHLLVKRTKLVLSRILKRDMQKWHVEVPERQSVQKDGVNCGVFVCWYLDRFLKNESFYSPTDLDTHSYRRHMIEVMINKVKDERTILIPKTVQICPGS